MSLAQAVAADRAGQLVEAADLYEALLSGGEDSLETLLDLAILYWQATDFGTVAALDLSYSGWNEIPAALGKCEDEVSSGS